MPGPDIAAYATPDTCGVIYLREPYAMSGTVVHYIATSAYWGTVRSLAYLHTKLRFLVLMVDIVVPGPAG